MKYLVSRGAVVNAMDEDGEYVALADQLMAEAR